MNVRCPHCQALYRVDPERVPEQGARTRCSTCAAVFELDRNGSAGTGTSSARRGTRAASAGTGTADSVPTTSRAAEPAPSPAPTPERPPGPAPAPAPAVATPAAVAGGGERPGERPAPVFGRQDPDTRAQRIARALVSDMVVYNGDRRDRSLTAGTLRVDFKEEILKSWEEYVAQVGQDMAKKTPHFRNALNQILAKGQAIF